jgi:hypothetical protein
MRGRVIWNRKLIIKESSSQKIKILWTVFNIDPCNQLVKDENVYTSQKQ